MAKPMAKAWPPKRVNRSAQLSMALSKWKPSTERPEPWATPSSTLTTMAGLAVRSTTREARMPMTPRCQPSPSITSSRSAASSASRLPEVFQSAERGASVSRRSRFSRSSLAASSVARAASRVENSSITSEATSIRPAALMRGARRKATSKPVICLAGGIERGRGKKRAQSRARRSAQLAQTQGRDHAILACSGTASAMVAIAAIFRKLGRVFSRVRAGSRRSSTACASFSAMAAPQRDFSG